MIVTGTVVLGFDTVAVNVNVPPGATWLPGLAAFVTAICGPAGAGVKLTVACAVAVTVTPLFTPVTVTVSVCDAPDAPANAPVKLRGAVLAPGCNVTPANAPHVELRAFVRSPYTLSTSCVIVTGVVVLGFDTDTVNVKSPPGAASVGGAAAFVTAITGAASGVSVTVACAVAVAVMPFESTPVTVTASVCLSPALPVKGPWKVQGGLVAPGARVMPISVPQVLPASVARFRRRCRSAT